MKKSTQSNHHHLLKLTSKVSFSLDTPLSSNTTTATKEATYNAGASVNTGFWGAVAAAKKVSKSISLSVRPAPNGYPNLIPGIFFNTRPGPTQF